MNKCSPAVQTAAYKQQLATWTLLHAIQLQAHTSWRHPPYTHTTIFISHTTITFALYPTNTTLPTNQTPTYPSTCSQISWVRQSSRSALKSSHLPIKGEPVYSLGGFYVSMMCHSVEVLSTIVCYASVMYFRNTVIACYIGQPLSIKLV